MGNLIFSYVPLPLFPLLSLTICALSLLLTFTEWSPSLLPSPPLTHQPQLKHCNPTPCDYILQLTADGFLYDGDFLLGPQQFSLQHSILHTLMYPISCLLVSILHTGIRTGSRGSVPYQGHWERVKEGLWHSTNGVRCELQLFIIIFVGMQRKVLSFQFLFTTLQIKLQSMVDGPVLNIETCP